MTPESILKDTGQQEVDTTPKKIVLHRTMFQEGTLGYEIFPDILNGRNRPQTIFNQPLTLFWRQKKSVILSELKPRNIITVNDVLNLSVDEINNLGSKNSIRENLSKYLNGLAVTPHAKLLETAFKVKQYPVPSQREQEVIDAVNGISYWRSEREILALRFGLNDGIIRTVQEIADLVGFAKESIIFGIERGVRALTYHPELKKYFSLPENSFAKELLGPDVTFVKDLPKLGYRDGLTSLSIQTIDEVKQASRGGKNKYLNFDNLIRADLDTLHLSPKTHDEIKEKLEEAISQGLKEELDLTQPLINKLLSEIPTSREQLTIIANLPINSLGLDVRVKDAVLRSNIKTVGQLLGNTASQIWNLRNIGKEAVIQIADGLETILQLPKEEYPEGLIRKYLLISSDEETKQERDSRKMQKALERKQESRQKIQENDRIRMQNVRDLIVKANALGLISAGEIQNWLIRERAYLLSYHHPESWITRAILEYVLSNPDL